MKCPFNTMQPLCTDNTRKCHSGRVFVVRLFDDCLMSVFTFHCGDSLIPHFNYVVVSSPNTFCFPSSIFESSPRGAAIDGWKL